MTSARAATVVATAALLAVIVAPAAATLAQRLAAKEVAVSQLAAKAEAAFMNRCVTLSRFEGTTASLRNLSQLSCGASFPEERGFGCSGQFGRTTFSLSSITSNSSITCPETWRNLKESALRIARNADQTNKNLIAFSVASQEVDAQFVVGYNARTLTAWQGFADDTGSVRVYPGAPQDSNLGSCSGYDARRRPWYIAAASGPKEIVIVFDKSGSMRNSNRMPIVRCAIQSILGSLTQNDFVNVVKFDSSASSVTGTETLYRATEDRVSSLQDAVGKVEPEGGTQFSNGLSIAYRMLAGHQSSACAKIILFLTDGQNGDSSSEIRNANANGQALVRNQHGSNATVNLFTFSLGSGASTSVPQSMACENNGVWSSIRDGEDPVDKMQGYYRYLASAIDVSAGSTPVWTSPYTDAWGLGRMITVSKAVYDRSQVSPVLAGVVFADLPFIELIEDVNVNAALLELQTRASCKVPSASECLLTQLRSASGHTCSGAPALSTCQSSQAIDLSTCSTSFTSVAQTVAVDSSQSEETQLTCCEFKVCSASSIMGVAFAAVASLALPLFILL